MAMAPHAISNENLDINSTVIRETPDVPSNSPDNNTTSGPQLDIKGPKIGDHPIIKNGPIVNKNDLKQEHYLIVYNHFLKSMLKSTNNELLTIWCANCF
ncbi:MAG: hypothetical protein IJI42_10760 [Methanobrevibacter sp.]|nr:hypothetical protein [Methanobrevibacter sp.]MBR0059579.1 hypothetical protein [Methanobrevibacter sp.]